MASDVKTCYGCGARCYEIGRQIVGVLDGLRPGAQAVFGDDEQYEVFACLECQHNREGHDRIMRRLEAQGDGR